MSIQEIQAQLQKNLQKGEIVLDPTDNPEPITHVTGTLTLAGINIPVTGDLDKKDYWIISLISASNQDLGLSDLSSLIGTSDITDLLPTDDNGAFAAVSLTRLLLKIGATDQQDVSLSFTVQVNVNWEIVPGLLEISSIQLTIIVTRTALKGSKTTSSFSGTLTGNINVGKTPLSISLSLTPGNAWSLLISSSSNSILPSIADLAGLLGQSDPESFLMQSLKAIGFNDFSLKAVEINFDRVAKKLNYVSLTGIVTIGQIPVHLFIRLPNFFISARLVKGNKINALSTLQHFIPNIPDPDGTLSKINVVALDLSANPSYQTYTLGAQIDLNWTIPLGFTDFIIKNISLSIEAQNNQIGCQFIGYFTLLDNVNLVVSAEHPIGNTGWIFAGGLSPSSTIKLPDIIEKYVQPSYSAGQSITVSGNGLDNLEITQLYLTIDTAQKTFSFAGAATWTVPIGDVGTFEVMAAIQITKPSGQAASGFISGSLLLDDPFFSNLQVAVKYTFAPDSKDLSFILTKGQLELDADLTWGAGKDTILTISLKNTTIGDILSFLVNLVDPYLDFKLDPPWDLLNSFSLDNLELVINITKKTVGVTYKGTIDLVFMQITSLTLTYETVNGESTVNISLDGTFLGQALDNPMKWDALNGTPPEVPGKGNKVFDLAYLGLGQHVSLPNVADLDTMSKVITALEQTVIPIEDSSANPLDQLPGLVFNSGSGLLIGAKFTIIDTLEMSVVFNDPLVYGLLIKLYGEKAKIFAGLEFEILYRKITDSIGVYHIELKLPDEMRHLEFGEVSITLPVFVLDIYTNGDFRIDLGFPTNGDFTRSFGVEVFPFVGAAGFYFAKLSGATATNIPQITNGVFNPVIEFGLGLSIGLGKEINEGILSAGISITVQGILEGVIAWFHPTDVNTPTDQYYRIEGSFSIVGHLYGSIDFVIIQASLDLWVYAGVKAIIESYQPIQIDLVAGVKVSLSIKVLFFTIHLSFEASINLHFTIGSVQPTPWILKPASINPPTQSLMAFAAREINFSELMSSVELDITAPNIPPNLNWSSVAVWKTTRTLELFFQPSFTLGSSSDDYNDPAKAGNNNPEVKGVALLFIENSVPQNPNTPQSSAQVSSFDLLVQGVLVWTIYAYSPQINNTTDDPNSSYSVYVQNKNVSIQDLQAIYNLLVDKTKSNSLFILKDLENFFLESFIFDIGVYSQQSDMSASFFPMFPELSLSQGNTSINFDSNPVTTEYLQKIQEFVQQLQVDFNNPVDKAAKQALKAKNIQEQASNSDTGQSIAAFVFQDYFAIVARSVIQVAIEYLKNQPGLSSNLATLLDELPVDKINNIAGMVSRFLLHGLRLPVPANIVDFNKTAPIFYLTQQEFIPPSPLPADYNVSLSNNKNTGWIKLAQGTTTNLTYTPGADETAFITALTGTPFSPDVKLSPMQLFQMVEKRYTFKHSTQWQPETSWPILKNGQSDPALTIWQFPQNLQSDLINSGTIPLNLTPYIGTPNNSGYKALDVVVPNCYGWGTFIPLKLRTIPTPNGTLQDTYSLVGTDENGRHLLENLLEFLNTTGVPANTNLKLYLLYPTDINNSSSLSSNVPANSLVVKTNLSTLSTSGLVQATEFLRLAVTSVSTPTDPFSANLANQPNEYIKLLWECSVVNTGGYYFNYTPVSGDAGLPGFLFADGQTASLSLLIVFELQNASVDVPELRNNSYSFHNALVLEDKIDSTNQLLFATAGVTSKSAVVTPGNVGFEMVRTPKSPIDPGSVISNGKLDPNLVAIKLDYLYNLLGYRVKANGQFKDSAEGLPVGPADSQNETNNPATNDGNWHYNKVVSFYPLIVPAPIANSDVLLPPSTKNPYSGIKKGAKISLNFTFHDVYGDQTPAAGQVPTTLDIDVGYTDPIKGLSQWPSLASTYYFNKSGDNTATLNLEVHFEPSKYLPGPTKNLAYCLNQATADQISYAQIYYQINQPDLSFKVSTTINRSVSADLDKNLFTALVNDVHHYLSTIQKLEAATYQITGNQTTLNTLSNSFDVAGGIIAQANSTIINFFTPGTSLKIPCLYKVKAGDSLQTIANIYNMTTNQIAQNSLANPNFLKPGTIINSTTFTTYVPNQNDTLAGIAKLFGNITAGDIAAANPDQLLSENLSLTIRRNIYNVNKGDTLNKIATAYNQTNPPTDTSLALTPAEIGNTNPNLQNLFQNTSALKIPVLYKLVANDTLARLIAAYNVSLDILLKANSDNPDLLQPGVSISITTEDYKCLNGDSLDSITQKANSTFKFTQPSYQQITVSDLANQNLDVSINPQMGPDPNRPDLNLPISIILPYFLLLNIPDGTNYSIHSIDGAIDTLQSIANNKVSVSDLITANQDIVSLLNAGRNVSMAGKTIPILANDTFRTLLDRFNNLYVVTQSAIDTLTVKGLPPEVLKSLNNLKDQVLVGEPAFTEALQKSIGIQASALYLFDLLQACGNNNATKLTIFDLASALASSTNLLADKKQILIPPQILKTNTAIDMSKTPYPTDTIFPVTVQIELKRDQDLVHPDFKDAPEVNFISTLLTPNLTSNDANNNPGLLLFAQNFEEAFSLKLATGTQSKLRYPNNCQQLTNTGLSTSTESTETSSVQNQPQQLWAVNLSQKGMTYNIQKQNPVFFGVAPLATTLLATSSPIPIDTYDSTLGLQTGKTQSFRAIDMEVLAHNFLEAVDQFLGPNFSVPAYILSNDPSLDSESQQALKQAVIDILNSKQDLATAIRDQVVPVYQGDVSTEVLSTAAEALYQRLLISLTSAFDVDTIVQYNVDVKSPCIDNKIAPRLSGQPIAQSYTTSTNDTLKNIAGSFSIKMPEIYLAQIIQLVKNILTPGVSLNGYTIRSTDTISTLAMQLNKSLAELVNAIDTSNQNFFKPNVNIPVAQYSLPTTANSTINSIARYFEVSPFEVVQANQDIQGLLIENSVIKISGYAPYTVQADDTLAKIASKIDKSKDLLEDLSNSIALQTGIIKAGQAVAVLKITPDFVASSSKVALSNGSSPLTFLFTAKTPGSQSRVFLDLVYRVNEIEYDLGSLPGIANYQASSWLSLIIPIDEKSSQYSNTIGQVDIPVPLRVFPTPPSLLQQTVTPLYAQISPDLTKEMPIQNLPNVKQWQYSYLYEHLDAAQDVIETTVLYNLPPTPPTPVSLIAIKQPRDLLEALLNFSQVYGMINQDLQHLQELKTGITNGKDIVKSSATAVIAFSTLVMETAAAWKVWKEKLQSTGFATSDYSYEISQTVPIPPENVLSVTVTATGSLALSQGIIPDIQVPGFKPLETLSTGLEVAISSNAKEFQFQPIGHQPSIPQVEVDMPGFDVLEMQNSVASIWLSRNKNLSPNFVTNPAFVFHTPEISFTNKAEPSLVDNTEWLVGTLNIIGTKLDEANLTNLLDSIFSSLLPLDKVNSYVVKLGCNYVFSLSSAQVSNPLLAKLPVLLIPRYAISQANYSAFSAILATTIGSWHENNQPSVNGGSYVISLGVFSNLSEDANKLLLQINNLQIKLAAS